MTARTMVDGRDRNAGFALFAVLSFMLIAAAVATPFLTGARTRALIARNVASELKERMAVRGLILIAAMRFVERARLSDPALPHKVTCGFDELSVTFTFQNHAGLVDLNFASTDLLSLGFLALGKKAHDAELLSRAVVEFRTVASGPMGTTQVPVRGGYKRLQFESVSELDDFTDPSAKGFRDAASIFTVHNGTGSIHAEDAPDALVAAIAELPASNAFFVVQGTTVATTVSVNVLFKREGKPPIKGETIVRSKEAASGMTFLSPIRISTAESDLGPSNADFSCSDFLGPELSKTVALLAGGQTR